MGLFLRHDVVAEDSDLAHLVEPGGRVPDLVARREVFPHPAVVADDDAELGRIEPGDDPGTERLERVAVLGAKQGAVGLLPLALAHVVADAVAEHAIEGVVTGDVARLLADDDRELTFGLDRAGRLLRHDDVASVPITAFTERSFGSGRAG